MDFFNRLKDFLIPIYDRPRSFEDDLPQNNPPRRNPPPPDDFNDEFNSFPIYTDPLEIHKYFEQQMNHMLKEFNSFGFGMRTPFGDQFHFGPSFGDFQSGTPQLEDRNLRDQFLKSDNPHRDHDLDHQNIDELFRGGPSMIPYSEDGTFSSQQREPRVHSFGHHSMIQSVRLPNGVVEHTRKVADSHGNVETTHTRMIGDQKYSITRKKNSQGQEEQIEDFQNMDESGLSQFEEKWKTLKAAPKRDPALPPGGNENDGRSSLDKFPYDKFFK